MEKMEVKKIMIGEQYEMSENYERLQSIAEKKNTKVVKVKAGDKLKIEKDLYFDILWPSSKERMNENVLNNNSMVCKLVYKNFSMLFTGDIEEIAEKAILEKYKNNFGILNASVLKVAHHGSKTSSTTEFLEAVSPKIALIGVGKNNIFGHPNDVVLKVIEKCGCKIYRTDKNGKITIRLDKKGRICLNKMLN